MKTSLITAAIAAAACAVALALSSCAELAGTSITITPDGVEIGTPAIPIVIPVK